MRGSDRPARRSNPLAKSWIASFLSASSLLGATRELGISSVSFLS
jgi:hypothetical protein